jgi:hypothetical protein
MFHNRIQAVMQEDTPSPRPSSRQDVPSISGFVMFSPSTLPGVTPEQWMLQQWLYQQALAEAQAVVRPSILERDLLGVWN